MIIAVLREGGGHRAGDSTMRSVRAVGLFYYLFATNPLRMAKFSYHYNTLWYGTPVGLAM